MTGQELKEFCEENGLKHQSEIADIVGAPQSTISNWLKSEDPPIQMVKKLAKHFNIPLYKFYMTEDDRQNLKSVSDEFYQLYEKISHLQPDAQKRIGANLLEQLSLLIELLEDK